jgi:hypothetical protein
MALTSNLLARRASDAHPALGDLVKAPRLLGPQATDLHVHKKKLCERAECRLAQLDRVRPRRRSVDRSGALGGTQSHQWRTLTPHLSLKKRRE